MRQERRVILLTPFLSVPCHSHCFEGDKEAQLELDFELSEKAESVTGHLPAGGTTVAGSQRTVSHFGENLVRKTQNKEGS